MQESSAYFPRLLYRCISRFIAFICRTFKLELFNLILLNFVFFFLGGNQKSKFQSIWKQIKATKVLLADISKPFVGVYSIPRKQPTHKVCIRYINIDYYLPEGVILASM